MFLDALYHEFEVRYVIVDVQGLLLLLLLLFFLVLALSITSFFTLLLFFFVLSKVCHLLHRNNLIQSHSNLLADLICLGDSLFDGFFITIYFLNVSIFTLYGFHSRELILSTPILRISSTSFPKDGDSLTLIKI